ncbi:MAG: ABC transporter ATP-binding protein, partial [Candidatus Micrarchaeota archaeon]
MEASFKIENVVKNYMEDSVVTTPALRGVSFDIKKGERIAIMGPSGCGKSTLLHILGCLDVPTSGDVYIAGIKTSRMSANELAHVRLEKIGFVFQSFNLIPTQTVMQNVMLPMMFGGAGRAEREKRARELLESVGLGHRLNFIPTKLSGGEKQRVAIARALANSPSIILADEPTGNLDSKA